MTRRNVYSEAAQLRSEVPGLLVPQRPAAVKIKSSLPGVALVHLWARPQMKNCPNREVARNSQALKLDLLPRRPFRILRRSVHCFRASRRRMGKQAHLISSPAMLTIHLR